MGGEFPRFHNISSHTAIFRLGSAYGLYTIAAAISLFFVLFFIRKGRGQEAEGNCTLSRHSAQVGKPAHAGGSSATTGGSRGLRPWRHEIAGGSESPCNLPFCPLPPALFNKETKGIELEQM